MGRNHPQCRVGIALNCIFVVYLGRNDLKGVEWALKKGSAERRGPADRRPYEVSPKDTPQRLRDPVAPNNVSTARIPEADPLLMIAICSYAVGRRSRYPQKFRPRSRPTGR